MSIKFWLGKKNRSWLQLTGCVVALSFLFSTVSVPFVEASLWAERREAAKDLRIDQATLIAQLPAVNNPLPYNVSNNSGLFGHSNSSFGRHSRKSGNLANITSLLDSRFCGNDDLIKNISWVTNLPINVASLRKVSIPSTWKVGDPMVLYVQDAHLNKDAQTNIGKSIQHFINEGKVNLVALEGAFNPIDISPFRKFEDQKVVHKVADYLLRENKISGAIHTAFTSPKEIPSFVGVDDKEHYWANVNAYKSLYPKVDSYKEKLSKLVSGLQQEKVHHFNPELLNFDNKIEAYRDGKEKLGDYIQLLTHYNVKEKGTVPLGTVPFSPQVKTFLETLKMEQSLDFTKVEKERSSIIEKLVKTLSKTQMQELLNASLAYRLGIIQHTDFYLYVEDLAKRNNISFTEFSAMGAYIRYLIASDKINAEKLFDEVAQLEEKAYTALAKSNEEKRLVEESKYFHLLGKLINSSLTRQEWNQYVQLTDRHSRESGNPEKTKRWLDYRFRENDSQNFDLSSFEAFYKESIIRDEKIASNLIRNIKEKNTQVAMLVTGGFHSDGVEAALHKNNIAVISYIPKIAKLDNAKGNEYLSVFTQEKTPLQKLFDGEKLFLPAEVLSNSATFEGAFATSVLGSKSPEQIDLNFDKMVGSNQFDIVNVEAKGEDRVVEVKGQQGTVQTTIDQEGNEIVKISEGKVERISNIISQVKSFVQEVIRESKKYLGSREFQGIAVATAKYVALSFYGLLVPVIVAMTSAKHKKLPPQRKIIWRFERHLVSASEALVVAIEKASKEYLHVNAIYECTVPPLSMINEINPTLAGKLGNINAYSEIIDDPQTRKEIEDFLNEYWWHYVDNKLTSLKEKKEVRFNPTTVPLFNYLAQHPQVHFYQERVPVEAVIYSKAYEAALKQAEQSLYHSGEEQSLYHSGEEQSLYHSGDEALFTHWMFFAGYYFWLCQAYRDKKVVSDIKEIITNAPPSSVFVIGRGAAHASNLSSFIEENKDYEVEVAIDQDWSIEDFGGVLFIQLKYRKDFETGKSLPSSVRKDLLKMFPYDWVSELMDTSKADPYERMKLLTQIFNQLDDEQVFQLTQGLLSSRLAEFLENEQIGSKEGQPNYGRGFFTLIWLKRYGLLTSHFEDYLDPAVRESLNNITNKQSSREDISLNSTTPIPTSSNSTPAPFKKIQNLLKEEDGQAKVEAGVIFGAIAGLAAPVLLLVAGAAVGVGAAVIYIAKKVQQKYKALQTKSQEEKVAVEVVSAIMLLKSGKKVDPALLSKSINTVLAEFSLSRDIQVLDGSNSILQAFEHLDEAKLEAALKAEFKKQSKGRLSKEEVSRLATQVLYEGYDKKALEQRLEAAHLDENTLVGAVLDPLQNPVTNAEKLLEKFREAQGTESKATLVFMTQALTQAQMDSIRDEAPGIKVEFKVNENLFRLASGNKYDLKLDILESILQSYEESKFTSYQMIIPQTLMGNLSSLGSLPQAARLRRAAIILVDEALRATTPILQFHNLEQIRHIAEVIAQQA
ncbi:MAG: hypothetical protein HYT97_04800 [Elusimicrobia bacterium]|nr:hypothetical protein [Elusimicrobiota bacterium]